MDGSFNCRQAGSIVDAGQPAEETSIQELQAGYKLPAMATPCCRFARLVVRLAAACLPAAGLAAQTLTVREGHKGSPGLFRAAG